MREKYVDSHIHLNEYSEERISSLCGRDDVVLIAVSEDLRSSLTNISIEKRCPNVRAAVGIHPWNVGKVSADELAKVLELVGSVGFVGEVGLDKRFTPETFDLQLKIFSEFVTRALSSRKALLLHAAGAWREVLEILSRSAVETAVIHWYTGPLEYLKNIEELGYFIGVNVALLRQPKMREVVKQAPLDIMLTESDGPYEYRGLRLEPELIPELIREIAVIKGVEIEEVMTAVYNNYLKLVGRWWGSNK